MKKQWITSTTPNCTGFLISPVGVPTVVVPIECIATDNDKLIYSTIEKYNGVLHRTMVTEDSVGDLFVHNLFPAASVTFFREIFFPSTTMQKRYPHIPFSN